MPPLELFMKNRCGSPSINLAPFHLEEMKMNAVIGMFRSFEDAERAIGLLKEGGFAHEDIGVLARGYLVKEQLSGGKASRDVVENIGTGAIAGTAVGGVLGLLASGISLAVPIIGPVLAAGSLVSMLSGAAAGAVYGGIMGALLGPSASEEEARFYLDGIEQGRIIISIKAEGERAAQAWELLSQAKALRANQPAPPALPQGE
jgi:hypothetical protein